MTEKNEKALVLFIAAEPRGSSPIRLGAEFRDVIEEVERNGQESLIEFRTLWAARPRDVTQAMSDYAPVIVHFSGHGTPGGGFLLESTDGSSKEINREGMGSLFNTLRKRVKVVVLNSCYSQELAKEISKYVDVVVGMKEGIGIEAAIRFSVGFYRGIASGESLHQCFKMAGTELDFEMMPESHIPVLHTRPGVEAFNVFAMLGYPQSQRGTSADRQLRRTAELERVETDGILRVEGHHSTKVTNGKARGDFIVSGKS